MPKPKAEQPSLLPEGEIAGAPDGIVRAALDCYNDTAKGLPWRQANCATEECRSKLRKAVKSYGGIVGFKAAMIRASKSPFLLAHTGRTGVYKNWKPTLAFFCQPKSIDSLLDGVYDPEPEEPAKVIIPSTWKPPHLAEQKPFVAEPKEVRLAAMIVSYRKHGYYDKANAIETELAALEGRPATHVPAPEVAREGLPEQTRPAPRKPAPTITDVPDWTAEEVPMTAYGEDR